MNGALQQPVRAGDLQCRRMTAADVPQVIDIEARIYPFPWTVGNFVDALAAGYDCWVFFDPHANVSLLGYAVVMVVIDEAHLLNLAVDAPYQGRGWGGCILDALMDDARVRGLKIWWLEVRPSNQGAVRVYERKGFQRVGLRRRYYPAPHGEREDAWVMMRRGGSLYE